MAFTFIYYIVLRRRCSSEANLFIWSARKKLYRRIKEIVTLLQMFIHINIVKSSVQLDNNIFLNNLINKLGNIFYLDYR